MPKATMVSSTFRRSLRVLSLGLFVLPALCLAQSQRVSYDAYHTFTELSSELQALQRAHSGVASLSSLGKSLEGRDIWLMTLGTGTDEQKLARPAVFVAANLEGNQVAGSELILQMLTDLLGSASVDSLASIMSSRTFYFVPRVNPDGAEKMFAAVRTGSATNSTKRDDDNDGRVDEDGPDDLNGDQLITLMRMRDSEGLYRPHSSDDRIMVKADASKGETGGWKVFFEGLDNDDDGFINEDAPGGIDLNRNFQHEYPYYQRGAGPHMISEPESRAVMDFLISHRSIGAMFVLGESDNLVNPPNRKGELEKAVGFGPVAFAENSYAAATKVGVMSSGRSFGRPTPSPNPDNSRRSSPRKPVTTVNTDDLPYFDTISARYKKLTGITKLPHQRDPAGALFQYGYFQAGIPAFSTPGWGITADTTSQARGGRAGASDKPSFEQGVLSWLESKQPEAIRPWMAFDHPSLGAVEIGGLDPYSLTNPPYSVLEAQSAKHAEFLLYLSSILPTVKLSATTVENKGGGIFKVSTQVENAGLLPTSLAHGMVSRSVRPTMVQIGVDPENVLTGDEKTSFFSSLEGSGRVKKFEWLIRGRAGESITIRAVSEKGGTDSATVTLR